MVDEDLDWNKVRLTQMVDETAYVAIASSINTKRVRLLNECTHSTFSDLCCQQGIRKPFKGCFSGEADYLTALVLEYSFGALTLLVGARKSNRPVKNWVMRCWRGYLSRARCK